MALSSLSSPGFSSLSQQVTAELRRAIIENRLKAKTQITESELSSTLGVSRTVVREAVAILINDGLLQKVSSHNTRVAFYTETDIREIYEMRGCLETSAVGLIPDPAAICGILQKNNDESIALSLREPFDGYAFVCLDSDFHTEIIKAAGNNLLLDAWNRIVGPLQVLLHRYIYYVVKNSPEKRASYDHQKIINTFSTGNRELIKMTLLDHSDQMKQIILEKLVRPLEEQEASVYLINDNRIKESV